MNKYFILIIAALFNFSSATFASLYCESQLDDKIISISFNPDKDHKYYHYKFSANSRYTYQQKEESQLIMSINKLNCKIRDNTYIICHGHGKKRKYLTSYDDNQKINIVAMDDESEFTHLFDKQQCLIGDD